MSRVQAILLCLLSLLAVATSIGAPFPQEILLQHIPTVLVVIALAVLARWWQVSDAAFGCIVLFMVLHVVGARYIYSYVPYDDWLEQVFGFRLSEIFGWRRNHYDRMVHFAYGLLIVCPSWEILVKHLSVSRSLARWLAVQFVLATSLVYELAEWALAMLLSPETAEAYNGQQGDVWDAQRDMALALLGALVGMAILMLRERRGARWHR